MYGGGAGNSARKQEQQRQNRVRTGMERINSVFTGLHGTNPLPGDAAYDSTAAYFDQYGQPWKPKLSTDEMSVRREQALYNSEFGPTNQLGNGVWQFLRNAGRQQTTPAVPV